MRTQEQIIARIEKIKSEDFFGFESSDLIDALDFEHAKPFLKPETTKEQWDEDRPPYTVNSARDKIRGYLDFAWRKANNERGISASRSQSHFRAWMWLACDDEVMKRVEDAEYEPYGKPKLQVIEDYYRHAPQTI